MKTAVLRRRLLILPLLVAAAIAAAGCGGSSSGGAAPIELNSLVGVADRTTSADTGRFEMTLRMAAPGGQEFEIGAEGAFDRVVERMQMTLDMSALAEMMGSLGAGGGVDLGSPEDWKFELILDKSVVYMHLPDFLQGKIPGGKPWLKGDVRTLTQGTGSVLGNAGLAGGDPRDLVRFLRAVSGDVQAVGREDVRGVSTSHYKATLDMQKLVQLAQDSSGASLVDLDSALKQFGLSRLPVDVWVDNESLLRRMQMSFTMQPPGSGESATFDMTFDVFDYGKPLFIELPAADQVGDASVLQGS